jgi:hypothetical protein
MITKAIRSVVAGVLVGGVLNLIAAGTATAESYDFSRFLSGGGGGADPAKQQLARRMGEYVCVSVSPSGGPGATSVNFLLSSSIPQRNSRVTAVRFDTGRHTDLFNNISVVTQPRGLKATTVRPSAHAFLPRVTPDFGVDFANASGKTGGLAPGLAPGQSILISANLGSGKSFADVIDALDEGISPDPATAAAGLRIGVLVLYLLGGPPKGVATIMDDGGFVVGGSSQLCQGR